MAKKKTTKTKNVISTKDAKKKISDIEVVGNPDLWVLICKASSKSEGWMKSTKAIEAATGCLVQVTTQQGNNVSEALDFFPGVELATDTNGNYRFKSKKIS